jgi:hypothetical protein
MSGYPTNQDLTVSVEYEFNAVLLSRATQTADADDVYQPIEKAVGAECDWADADSGPFQRRPLRIKNGRKSSRSFKDGSDFLRTIPPYQQVTIIDASFWGSCAVGVPFSIRASEIKSLT